MYAALNAWELVKERDVRYMYIHPTVTFCFSEDEKTLTKSQKKKLKQKRKRLKDVIGECGETVDIAAILNSAAGPPKYVT